MIKKLEASRRAWTEVDWLNADRADVCFEGSYTPITQLASKLILPSIGSLVACCETKRIAMRT